MGAVPDCDLLIPAKSAAYALYAVCYDGFSVSGAPEYDAAIVDAGCYCFCDWANEVWIIAGFSGIRTVILYGVALSLEVGNDRLFVIISGVVGADCNGEFAHCGAVFRVSEA